MRHLVSIALSLVLTPVIVVFGGYGAVKVADSGPDPDYASIATGGVALIAVGLAYAVLILVRLAPTGPALAGLVMMGLSFWAYLDPAGFLGSVPDPVLGTSALLVFSRFGPLLAVPLLLTLASPRRWRRYDRPGPSTLPPSYPPATQFGPAAPRPAPAYPPGPDLADAGERTMRIPPPAPANPPPAQVPGWPPPAIPPDPDRTQRL